MKSEEFAISELPKKKRKTLDDLIGTNVMLAVATFLATVTPYGGFVGIILFVAGTYKLIKHRAETPRNKKAISIALMIAWLVLSSIPSIVAYIDATSQM